MRSAFSAAKISKLHLDGQVPLSMMNKMELMPPDEEDEDHLELLDPEDFPAHQSLRYLDATGSGSEGSKGGTERKSRLSFPRGRAPPLPNGVRTRNLDVGARIGRRQNDPARPGTDGSETKKANAMEEQMRRIENRKEGDEKLNACRKALEQAKWERGLDSIPYLPGRWTEKLHSKVLGCLRECQDTLEKAERLYASAEAKDKVPESTDLKEQLRGAEQHAKNTKEAWLVLGDAEAMLQEAARKGWPHGQREFEQAVAMVHKARECFLEIGEAGAHDTGQVRPREKMLKKMSQRVLTVRKECERRRCKVQVLLNRLGHAKWETRFQAMLEMAEIGRQPVPCSVTFLGELVSTVDEKEWHENTGRGDSQVVDGILSMMKDTESEVRRVVVDSLPRVCQAGDPLVLEAISSLTADPVNKVKCNAMDALAHLSERGNQMVVKNLCAMLEDADTAVRNLGVRLLPLVTNKPADNFAIDEVLTRLDHKRRFDEHPHWITEERDVRLAALKTLTLIAPHGHDKVIRRLAMVLRNSWDILIRDFTGCARNADEPHKGSSSDYGFSRGPVSLRAQLKAIETEAACRCPAKCGEAAAAVRIAAIEVLVAVSIKRTDLAWQRKQLNEEYEDGNRSPLGMSRAPSQMSGGSGRDSGRSTPGSKTPGNKTPGNKTPGHKTPGKYTPYSFSRTASNSNKAEWLAQRAMLKTQQDKAFGDLVRYTTVVECLCERLCDMDREVRWTAARALVQHVADIDDTIVVEALAKSLEHSESEVRQLAIEMIKGSALGVIVSPGNEEMTDAICKRFVSSRPATRSAAALALMGHCNVGDHNAIYFLIPQLWHPDSHVRQDALVTLKKLVPKGNSDVLRNVEKGAFEPDPSLRIMAIYALSELADSDDNVTGALLEDMLFDQDDSVVCAATFAVANLAQRGDADALDVLLNNCEDMSEAVRRASIQALTRISNKGDVAVVEAALKLIDDPDSSVRNQALETLTNVADKGNTKVCAKIIARLGTQGGDGVRAIAELRDLRWSTSRSISFTFGSVGPPGTTHSGVFEWSQPPSLTVGEDFRMPGGVPVTDGAGVRSKTWGGNFVRNATVTNNKSGNWEGVEGASVTWGPTTRLPKTGQSLADYEGYPDAPVDTRPPTTSVINLPFAVRPTTAPTAGPPLVFRLGAELHAVSRPGTRQSTRLGTTSSVSTFARVLYSPLFLIDSDGGYDSIFGLVLLSLAGLVPQLVTTVHGMGEAVSSAVNIKRLYATLQSPQVPVVPSVDSALVRNKDGKLCLSRPGTSLVRLDGSTRRVPSRFGPDYRRHLAELGDHLFLTPLGVSYEKLLQPPGLTLRVANLERDLRLLAMVAGANVSDLEVELAALAQSLEALNQRGKDYYAEQGRGLSRDGRPPSGLVSLNSGTYGSHDFNKQWQSETLKTGGYSTMSGAMTQNTAHTAQTGGGHTAHTTAGTTGVDGGLVTGGGRGGREKRDTSPPKPLSKEGGILRPVSLPAGDQRQRSSSGTVDRVEIKTPDVEAVARRTSFAEFHEAQRAKSSRHGRRQAYLGESEDRPGTAHSIKEEEVRDEGGGEPREREAWEITPQAAEKEAWELTPQAEKEAWEIIPPATDADDFDILNGGVSLTYRAGSPAVSRGRGRRVGSGSPPLSPFRTDRGERLSTAVSSGSQDGRVMVFQEEKILSPPESGDNRVVVNNRAVAALLGELAQQDDKSVTMLCLSSLTNLAGALEADPDLVHQKMKNVVVMGGATRVSPSAWHDHAYYTQGGAEFNFYFDSEATYRVIHSGLEIVMIGLEVANADVCSPDELQKLIAAQLSKKGGVSTPAWLLRALMLAFDMSVSYAAVAAFHLVHPEYFRLEKVWVRVEPHSGKISEVVPGSEASVPVMLATELRKDKYIRYIHDLLTDTEDGAGAPRNTHPSLPATSASKNSMKPPTSKSLQECRHKTVLTLAGREPVGHDVKTSGSKMLRLESIANTASRGATGAP